MYTERLGGYWIDMNRLLSSIMLATLTLLTAIPFSAAPAAATSGAIISTDQPLYSGVVGSTFQVAIILTNQPMLIGYDFSLTYNNAVLSCLSYDDHGSDTIIGPFFASGKAFQFVSRCSDPEGIARSAYSLSGGISTNALSGNLAVITFQVIGNGNSDLVINHVQLVCVVGSSTGACPGTPTLIGAEFLVAPDVGFRPPGALPGFSPVVHLRTGQTTIQYNATIRLSPSDVRAGFGAVFITATDPLGNQVFAQSNIAFMFQGDTTMVFANLDFSSTPTIGTWSVTATVLECATAAICVPGASQPAHSFKIKS